MYKLILMQEEVSVVGFEVPRSPDSSYNNPFPTVDEEARDPPLVPPHLQYSLLSYPPSRDGLSSLPSPQNVTLNHLYIENRESPRSVVAVGFTHRFRAKYVSVVLYKPVQRRWSLMVAFHHFLLPFSRRLQWSVWNWNSDGLSFSWSYLCSFRCWSQLLHMKPMCYILIWRAFLLFYCNLYFYLKKGSPHFCFICHFFYWQSCAVVY